MCVPFYRIVHGVLKLTRALYLFLTGLYPRNVFLNRGNHETSDMNKVYGFEGETKKKYSELTYKLFEEVFTARTPLLFFLSARILADLATLQFHWRRSLPRLYRRLRLSFLFLRIRFCIMVGNDSLSCTEDYSVARTYCCRRFERSIG